jgi:hypothetical protein
VEYVAGAGDRVRSDDVLMLAMTDAVSITPGARDQHSESLPIERANMSGPREINHTSASWRQAGGKSCVAGSQRAPWDLIAV